MDKTVWEIKDPTEEPLPPNRTAPITRRLGLRRSPAIAFSLSLLIWGGGQFYNRQRDLGILFFLLLANYALFTALCIIYWDPFARWAASIFPSPSRGFLIGGALYLSFLLIWITNALQAYFKATKTHAGPFEGVRKPLLPLVCSLLLPGWGQMLNGQPRKGCFLLAFTFLAGLAVPLFFLTPVIWPRLESPTEKFFLEVVLLSSALLVPLLVLLWVLGAYDAVKTGFDPIKKEPLRKRIHYAANRVRMKGWINGLMPHIRTTLLMGLLLAAVLSLGIYFFPKAEYYEYLERIQAALMDQQMTLIPRAIEHLLPAPPHA